MNITIIGAGYVGLVTAACFAELGHDVTCIDVNADKIAKLNSGIIPIYEPGLEALIAKNITENRLCFSTSLVHAKFVPHIFIIAVGTPCGSDGNVDIQYVLKAAQSIGENVQNNCLIVDKSTVPVGMADQVSNIIKTEIARRKMNVQIEMVSNPEFLREGAAIQDFMFPDRVIIGCESTNAQDVMFELYSPLVTNKEKIYFMSVKDAEMTKYVANAMLATKISLMNEIATLCEKIDVDVENVRMGIGADSRIGPAFIYPGCGYGGSCFPKDIKALIKMAEQNGMDPLILHAIEDRNILQKQVLPNKIINHFGKDLTGLRVGVWGLSFKPNTDDMREASSLVLLENLLAHNAHIQVFDPAAMSVARRLLPFEWINSGEIIFAEDQYSALKGVDALVLVTEWSSFLNLDFAIMKKHMRQYIIFDGRNQYDPSLIRDAGFLYFGIGRGYQNFKDSASYPVKEYNTTYETYLEE